VSGLTCKQLMDFLMAYLDGELPDDQRAVFEEHLAICTQCVDYLDTYKKTVELAAGAWCDDDELPGDVPEDLVQAILAPRRRGP